MSNEILPSCTHCHAPARERRISKYDGSDITLCLACQRRLHALIDWDNEQLLESEVFCPYCGFDNKYSWEYEEGCQEVECCRCGRVFDLEVVIDVKYTTSRRGEDMPDDYIYMSEEERYAYGEKLAEES